MATVTAISPVSNDAEEMISAEIPYGVEVSVEGISGFLFHRWSVDGVEAQSRAAKGSKVKRQDNLESYVYRLPEGELAIPGEYFRMATIAAAKFRQDPRSPRKSAMDLFKAGVIATTELCGLGAKDWDYIDRRRVTIQRNGITRCRPAMQAGWRATVSLMVNLPEYIPPQFLNETIQAAGRLIGVGDFRPTFGRFVVTGFTLVP